MAPPIPSNHPLRYEMESARERVKIHDAAILALKAEILRQFAAWEGEVTGIELDGDGTFVYEGVRERILAALPGITNDSVTIDGNGWITLRDAVPGILIGAFKLPGSDLWGQRRSTSWANLSHITAVPESQRHSVDPRTATPEGPGAFQLNEDQTIAAHAAMAESDLRSLAGLSTEVLQDTDDEDRFLRFSLNAQDARDTHQWILRNIPQ